MIRKEQFVIVLVKKETTTNRHVAVVAAESGRQRQGLDAIGWWIALEDPTRKWQKCGGRGHEVAWTLTLR